MSIDAGLKQAYLDTTYRVRAQYQLIDIRVGVENVALDQLLLIHGVSEWAFLTASNPGSRLLGYAQNRIRNVELEQSLRDADLHFLHGVGVPDLHGWPQERSYLVLGINRLEAVSIAMRWGQSAIVWGEAGAKPQLIEVE